MLKKLFLVLFTLGLCFTVVLPASGEKASVSSTNTDSPLIVVSEEWRNRNTGHIETRSYYATEFFVLGPDYEQWMVSIAGNKFRLRDKTQVNPTIYTSSFFYRGWEYGAGEDGHVISVAELNPEGKIWNPYFYEIGINTIRYSGNYEIISFIRN